MKSKKNKTRSQKAGFKFLTDMWSKGKDGWNKGTKSISNSSKNLFSSKPKSTPPPVIQTNQSYSQPPPVIQPNQSYSQPQMQTFTNTSQNVNNQTPIIPPTTSSSFSNPSLPATSGGRRKKGRKGNKSRKGGYNLANSSSVHNEKTASPTYWINGGRKLKSRRAGFKSFGTRHHRG
jgi:hypothetical protein